MKKCGKLVVVCFILIICLLIPAGCGVKPDLYYVSYSGATRNNAEEAFGEAFKVTLTDPIIMKVSPKKGDYVVIQMPVNQTLSLNDVVISEDGGEWVDYLLDRAKMEYNRNWSDSNAFQDDVEELVSNGVKVLMYVRGVDGNGDAFCTEAYWMEKDEIKSETKYYFLTSDYNAKDAMKEIREYFRSL